MYGSLSINNSDLGTLFKQKAKLKKTTMQGQHNSCEEAKTQAQPIVVEEERWDAYRGIPKLRCLRLLEILSWGALGILKLEILCLLNSFHVTVSLFIYQKLHSQQTQQELVRQVSINQCKTLSFSTVRNQLNYYSKFHTKCLCIFNTPILKQNH